MPITLPPISRRELLAGSVCAAAGLAVGGRCLRAAERRANPHRFALLSDTHVAADRAAVTSGVNMAEHLRRACADVLAGGDGKVLPPAAAFVTGDLALRDGQDGDYVTLLELLAPLRAAHIPLHLGLGNHDDRDSFWAAAGEKPDAPRPVEARHVAVVESPKANWFLLDSLDRPNVMPGVLGEAQLGWLGRALDAAADRPAVVLVHHNPDAEHGGGLTDTAALLDVLMPRKQVKALVFGHTHAWGCRRQDGLHLVNLPPVAYIFEEGRPSGWVDTRVTDRGATLTLRCIDPRHRQHGETVNLAWRD